MRVDTAVKPPFGLVQPMLRTPPAVPIPPIPTATPCGCHQGDPQSAASNNIPQPFYPGQPISPFQFSTLQARPFIQAVAPVQPTPPVWTNHLKQLFWNRQAITYALHIRSFGAADVNCDGRIDPQSGENGTFLSCIPRLKELKKLGVNNIHVLPILPVGEVDRLGSFGAPGSVYAPSALDHLNDEYRDPRDPRSTVDQAKAFVDACHREGIHVMMDIPSCASVDLARERPDLMAHDAYGNLLTPTTWTDIRMFSQDTPALRAYYQQFFNLMNYLGVDGYRADVARARTTDFWRHFIGQTPQKAWLAESYVQEDATSTAKVPRDIPEDLLRAGFDSFYGQFHIFQDWNANQYIDYLNQNHAMFKRVGLQKSAIGSFLTHDDHSAMLHGGPLYCKLVSGLMATQPDTNPYILDGFTTGHRGNFEIFNFCPRPQGLSPDIGRFLNDMLTLRQSPQYNAALTLGAFIPLSVKQSERDPQVIAFLRRTPSRTLLVLANKDVNAFHDVSVNIAGFEATQPLMNLAPHYGAVSRFIKQPGQIQAHLGPGRFHLFDITSAAANNTQPLPVNNS